MTGAGRNLLLMLTGWQKVFIVGIAGLGILMTILTPYPAIAAVKTKPQMAVFDFTPPPLEPQQEVDIGQWSRVAIMELHRPTFEGRGLNVADQELAASWARIYDSTRIFRQK